MTRLQRRIIALLIGVVLGQHFQGDAAALGASALPLAAGLIVLTAAVLLAPRWVERPVAIRKRR